MLLLIPKWIVPMCIIVELSGTEETFPNITLVRSTETKNVNRSYIQRSINSGLNVKNRYDEDGKTSRRADNINNILPKRSVCGVLTDEDRIFGGENAGINEFPWLVRIKYILENGKEVYACAGSLISDKYVITAAHCAVNLTIKEVRLGDWNTETDPDCEGSTCNDLAVDIKVVQVTPFPKYSKSDTFKGDIALLKLQRPVQFTEFIRPICLPITEEVVKQDYLPKDVFWTAGWGKTENEKKSTIKQKLSLPAVSVSECQQKQPINEDSAPFVICAGGMEGKDTCVGDSGGSLVKQISANNLTNWFLVGVTSYGYKHCGIEGRPGLYARIGPLMDWILHNMSI